MTRLSPVHHRAWRAFLAAHARLIRRLAAELERRSPLSLSEFEVLEVLERMGGRLRMAELAEEVLTSRSGLTRRVDRLESRGHVRRQPSPEDKRGSFAVLTEGGRHALRESLPVYLEEVRRWFVEPLAEERIDLLAQSMEQVVRRLSAQAGGEPGPAGRASELGEEVA